jgi:hypothetical protein
MAARSQTSMREAAEKVTAHLQTLQQKLANFFALYKEERKGLSERLRKIEIDIGELSKKRKQDAAVQRQLEEATNELKDATVKFQAIGKTIGQLVKILGPTVVVKHLIKEELANAGVGVDSSTIAEIVKQQVKERLPTVKGGLDEETVRRLVNEELRHLPHSAQASASGVSRDQLREMVKAEVTATVKGSNVVMVQPKEFLLTAVLNNEIEKVRVAVEGFKPQTRLMLGYLVATGKSVSFKELMTRFVGSDDKNQRQEFLYPLENILSVVNYDSGHSNVRYIWREKMKENYPDLSEEELAAALNQVHMLLADKAA